MTLADLVRQYLENRRKYYAQKTWFLEQNNFLSFLPEDDDDELIKISDKQYFSNNIDPKNDRANGSPQSTVTRQIGVSKSRRQINLPDGSVRIETIIRDSNGNVEKHITTQKGDKKHTIIIRKDASGVEKTEEEISNANDDVNLDSPAQSWSQPDFQHGVDSGYDFWFHKFFKPDEKLSNDEKFNNTPFDFNAPSDEQLEKILRKFTVGGFFDPKIFKNSDSSTDQNDFGDISDFSKLNDSILNDETRKLIENFEKSASNSIKTSKKKNPVSTKKMDALLKSIAPSPPPSMFDRFAENAMIEIPDEKTPLDRFVKLDEDQINSLKVAQGEQNVAIRKLMQYFSPTLDPHGKDVYSDIDHRKDAEVSLILPEAESHLPSNDIGEMFRRAFHSNSLGGSSQTKMLIENGKKRIESIRKNEQGLTQKTITYESGNKQYSVVIVTNELGKIVKRHRNFNFSEDELQNFMKQWSKEFYSDFKE